jgi:hypothetical protein
VGVRKGHQYISLFADLVKKRVLFATEDRHALTEVSMDPGVRPISRGCGRLAATRRGCMTSIM